MGINNIPEELNKELSTEIFIEHEIEKVGTGCNSGSVQFYLCNIFPHYVAVYINYLYEALLGKTT